MATAVWVIVCTEAPVLTGTTLAAQCPVASRLEVVTTNDILSGLVTTPVDPMALDGATVTAVFGISFTTVILFYLIARGAGTVLRLIRFG